MAFGRRTPVTTTLLAAIAVGFGLQFFLGDGLIAAGANYGPAIWEGQYWRLVTSMFLHGGILHLAFNAYALYQLGALFEILLGSVPLLVTYFVSGVAGSLASALWSASDLPSVGASGAIFGLMGALIAFLLKRRDMLTPQAKSLLFQLIGWAAINVVLGFSIPRIDNAAHLGGCAVGFLIGLILPDPAHRAPGF